MELATVWDRVESAALWAAAGIKAWALAVADVLQFWQGYETELSVLATYAVGIAVYAAIIFLTCETISRRDLLRDRGESAKPPATWWGQVGRDMGYLLLYPVVTFSYFAFLSVSLFFLAKDNDVPSILVASMGIVVALRLAAYFTSRMALDVAKLLPLSLLAVFVISPGYVSMDMAWARVWEAVGLAPVLVRYFIALACLEAGLRLVELGWEAWTGRTRRRRLVPAERKADTAEFAVADPPAVPK